MSSVFRKGAGFDESLTGAVLDESDLINVNQEVADELVETLDALTTELDRIFNDVVLPFAGIDITDPSLPAFRINEEWLIESPADFTKSDLITVFPITELSQLTDYPYLLAAGNKNRISGDPIDRWEVEGSTYYNDDTGLAARIDDKQDGDWYITYTKVGVVSGVANIASIATPSKKYTSSPSIDRDVNIVEKTFLNGNEYVLTAIDELATIKRTTISKLRQPEFKFRNALLKLFDKLGDIQSLRDLFQGPIKKMLPYSTLAAGKRLLASMKRLKNDTVCAFAGVINAASAAKNYITGQGDLADTLMDSAQAIPKLTNAKYPSPSAASGILTQLRAGIVNCFDLSWLTDMILGFLKSVLDFLKDFMDFLKDLFNFDTSRCGASGGATKFMFDLCNVGVKIPMKGVVTGIVSSVSKVIEKGKLDDSLVRFEGVSSLDASTVAAEDAAVEEALADVTLTPQAPWEPGQV